MTNNVGIISNKLFSLKWCFKYNNSSNIILNSFFNNSYNKFGFKICFHSFGNINKKWKNKNKNKCKNYILLVKKNKLHNNAHIRYEIILGANKKHTNLSTNKYGVNFSTHVGELFHNKQNGVEKKAATDKCGRKNGGENGKKDTNIDTNCDSNKLTHRMENTKDVEQNENVIRINNLCKKIYDIGNNGVKNKKEWIHYLVEYYKEEENYKFIKNKEMFMLLIGLTKLKEKINIIYYRENKENEKNEKNKRVDDMIDRHIQVLSKKINELTNKQLSIFLYILEKWEKLEKHKKIVNIINDKILKKKTFKKLNVRSFCNALYIYSKKNELGKNGSEKYGSEKYGSEKYDIINFQINKFLTKLNKSKCSVEDMLLLISSIDKLKIKIKEKSMIENVVKVLNDNIQDTNYFIIPSLLLYLSNLNIYNKELYLKLKNVILENYHFYNSIHLTNIFYAFSKFKPDFAHDLFDTLSHYIIHTFLKQAEKEKEKEKENENKNSEKNADEKEGEHNKPALRNAQINANKFLKCDEKMFNMFQITNIINSCIKCDYINYNFFHDLILLSEKIEEHSLDNFINFFKSISNILKTFNIHIYKYIIYFYNIEKEECVKNDTQYIQNYYDKEKLFNTNQSVYLYSLIKKDIYYKQVYKYFTNNCVMTNLFFIEQYNTFGGIEKNMKIGTSNCIENVTDTSTKLINILNKIRDNVSEQIRIRIENNLYDKNLKYILHNLMIFMYQSKIKYINLYTLCISIIEKNIFFFSINNLYLYIKIFNTVKIYNYEIFYNIFDHIYTNFDQFELKKKAKIILLYYDIFKKINDNQMQLLINCFLDNTKFCEKNKIDISKYNQINDKHKINNYCNIYQKWLLPTNVELKQNILNTKKKSTNYLFDSVYNSENNDEINLNYFLNNKKNNDYYIFSEKNEKQYSTTTDNSQLFLKKIEQTEIVSFSLNFNEYINLLVILIYDISNKILDNKMDEKKNTNISIISLISKDETNLIKIKNEDPVLEKYSEMVRQNLNNRKHLIIKILLKIADMIKNKNKISSEKKIKKIKKIEMDEMDEADETGLHIDQVLYILYFIKLLDKDLYSSMMEIDQIERVLKNGKNGKNAQNERKWGDNGVESKQCGTLLGSSLFELKKEDMKFIGSNNRKKNNESEIYYDDLFLYDDKINYRYKYQSVNDSIKNITNNLKKMKFNEITKFDNTNKCSFKINKFYKLDTYINIDILFILEKNGEEFFHFLIFYPYELKKIITNIKKNNITFTHSYDESFSFCTEILCIYNFLKKNNKTNFSFSILDTTSFVNFSDYTCENVEVNKNIKLRENQNSIHPLFNHDLDIQKLKKLIEGIISLR
ncbi:conserved Plasmodium protein, unknown function [Plasmodium yoelii]|uniref:Uncharacterized protein n=2 Tax=Plasmodium yoelii TaxID=5861 RepID=A0AAE9WM00_PLAYO|nr:conserved Plasmodium protein, unknown function [Plasmodium yoelii]WBY54995.1 hypothetical protein Py17XNL_000303653 [Plasmodium yoelii yoelii]CDU16267.1 conserved Plasmodium protein, unknown function [Plasmodium yoelii]VTZ72492.1 conserved Plasmodium protein, unknown function [Plasmodium yoelii]|eukprot:XP_724333.2 conserved Plasmodium protein, unknown function [Plasmodium yoelii]